MCLNIYLIEMDSSQFTTNINLNPRYRNKAFYVLSHISNVLCIFVHKYKSICNWVFAKGVTPKKVFCHICVFILTVTCLVYLMPLIPLIRSFGLDFMENFIACEVAVNVRFIGNWDFWKLNNKSHSRCYISNENKVSIIWR